MLHLLPLAHWRAAERWIAPPSLEQEGFVHCTDDTETLVKVANHFYRDDPGAFVVLVLDPDAITAEIRYEAPVGVAPGLGPDLVFPHVYGPIEVSAVREVLYARRELGGRFLAFEERPAIAEAQDLLPHPEGGWFRRIWTSSHRVRSERGDRATASAILYFLAETQVSQPHTVTSDEMWIVHGPGDLDLRIDDHTERLRPIAVGGPMHAVVPAGARQSARAIGDVLVTCVVSPEFDFADFTLG